MWNKIQIDLGTYRTIGSKVFTGRDRGIEVRDKSKINADTFEATGKRIKN